MVIVNTIGTTINFVVLSSGERIAHSGAIDNLKEEYVELIDSEFNNNHGYVTLFIGSGPSGVPPASYAGLISQPIYPKDKDAIVKLSFVSPQ